MVKADLSLSFLSAIKRHLWIALFTLATVTLGASAISLAILPRLYQASARLLVGEKDVGISALGEAITTANTQVPGRVADPVATQAELVKSQKVLHRALETFKQESGISSEKLPADVNSLSRDITVDILPATNIVKLTYQHPDPEIAAGLINAVSQAMVVENIEETRSKASTLRWFLEKQIPQQDARLRQAEAAESDYRQQHGIVSFEEQTQSMVSSLAALANEERSLRAQLQESLTKGDLLQQVTGANTPASAYTAVRVGQDETLKALQKQLTDLDVTIADARSRLGDQHPQLLALLQKQKELQALYAQQLAQAGGQTASVAEAAANPLSQDLISRYITGEIDRQALSDRLRVVQAELQQLRSQLSQLPSYQQPLAVLMRKREAAESALKLLNDKLEEARIAEGQVGSNVRIVGQAEVPKDIVSPKPLAIIVVSTVAGLILAGAMVLLLELLETTLRDASEAATILKLPVLGQLPRSTASISNSAALAQFLDEPNQTEPYRALLKTLEVLNEQKQQVIVFSGTGAEEGKSAVIAQLASVAAILSRRTLIIDADLRDPVQHHLLNIPSYPGLTDVAKGNLSFREAVHPTGIENLDILPCGQAYNRPSALIESDAMTKILVEAAANYDCVLIDSAPASICADAATLSQLTNGLVLVVRPHLTRRDAASQILTDLQRNGAPVLGTVINEATPDLEKRSPNFSLVGRDWQILSSTPAYAKSTQQNRN